MGRLERGSSVLSSGCRVVFAISLDCDDVGAPTPPQIRCCDVSPAVLPGADEMLKLGSNPWPFQVLNCGIEPAQEPPPVSYQQVWRCGHPSLRMMHHPFCLANLPFDFGAICLHQVHELILSYKWRRWARQ